MNFIGRLLLSIVTSCNYFLKEVDNAHIGDNPLEGAHKKT